MSIRRDVEEIQTTRTEKLLAVVLAAFLLLGGIWTYQKLDDVVRHHTALPSLGFAAGPATERLRRAEARATAAQEREQRALADLELRREAYRTALEAHRPATALGRRYDAAQAELARARATAAAARSEAQAARPAAAAESRVQHAKFEAALDRQERDSFLARLTFVLLTVGAAYALLAWGRRRASRWFPLAGSVVAFATIMAFVLASDYLTDYFDPFDWGLALVAGVGIVATLLAYWGLQRYLIRRLPQRRVRRRQCPFCGYPAGDNVRCEGCGREVVAACSSCEAPRRVGSAHCATCGAAAPGIRAPGPATALRA